MSEDVNIDTVAPGTECFHKATNKKCVVLNIIDKDKKLVTVRDSDDIQHEYYTFELRLPQSGVYKHKQGWAY